MDPMTIAMGFLAVLVVLAVVVLALYFLKPKMLPKVIRNLLPAREGMADDDEDLDSDDDDDDDEDLDDSEDDSEDDSDDDDEDSDDDDSDDEDEVEPFNNY